MKSRELRTFNLVQVKGDAKQYWTVMAIDGVHDRIFLDAPRDNFHSIDKIKPIELTSEWLERLGLVYDEFLDCYFYQGDIQFFHKEMVCFKQKELDIVVEYVHQLQNLYFSLTQTELTLKP